MTGVGKWMKRLLIPLALAFTAPGSAQATRAPPLTNSALLNIGYVCRWDQRCMSRQEKAMNHALKYVGNRRPQVWKVQLCNRNAARKRSRVDWIGFNNCIRNDALRGPSSRLVRRRPA